MGRCSIWRNGWRCCQTKPNPYQSATIIQIYEAYLLLLIVLLFMKFENFSMPYVHPQLALFSNTQRYKHLVWELAFQSLNNVVVF